MGILLSALSIFIQYIEYFGSYCQKMTITPTTLPFLGTLTILMHSLSPPKEAPNTLSR